jgi:hypothetical protein
MVTTACTYVTRRYLNILIEDALDDNQFEADLLLHASKFTVINMLYQQPVGTLLANL